MQYAELPDYLVSASLYRTETLADPPLGTYPRGGQYLQAPDPVDRECPTCGPTKWSRSGGPYEGKINEGQFAHLTYKCRNCEKTELHVFVIWWRKNGVVYLSKVGQHPKLAVTIPKEFERALGAKRDLYVKGMTSRHSGYGIGAMSYFRRLIEDTTDEMLDLLEGAMKETGADQVALDNLKRATEGIRFEDKVKIAAEVIPAHLRPGGINPFGDLYGLLSIGLHDLTDEECCDMVDAMDRSLKFVYTQLKTHTEDAKAYEEAAKSINATVGKLKGREKK